MPRTTAHLPHVGRRRKDDTYAPLEVAMRIALRWCGGPSPSAREIMAEFPMSRAAAFRYRRHLRDARGEP